MPKVPDSLRFPPRYCSIRWKSFPNNRLLLISMMRIWRFSFISRMVSIILSVRKGTHIRSRSRWMITYLYLDGCPDAVKRHQSFLVRHGRWWASPCNEWCLFRYPYGWFDVVASDGHKLVRLRNLAVKSRNGLLSFCRRSRLIFEEFVGEGVGASID